MKVLKATLLAVIFLQAPAQAEEEAAVLSSSTEYCVDFVVELRGDHRSAAPLEKEVIGEIPFGLWLNAIQIKHTDKGFEFATQIEDCSRYGCTLETGDTFRTIIAKRGMSDAIRFSIYDVKWQRAGSAAISDKGWVAIPMSSEDGRREIWIIKPDSRMHRRISNPVLEPVILKWRGNELFMLRDLYTDTVRADRVLVEKNAYEKASADDPYFFNCAGAPGNTMTAGFRAEQAASLEGRLSIPLRRKDLESRGVLMLTSVVRPLTPRGFASPIRVLVDCRNRINLVTGLGSEVWCMRFGEDGSILAATRVSDDIVGDASSIRIDSTGTFSFVYMEMGPDLKPEKMRLARLR